MLVVEKKIDVLLEHAVVQRDAREMQGDRNCGSSKVGPKSDFLISLPRQHSPRLCGVKDQTCHPGHAIQWLNELHT